MALKIKIQAFQGLLNASRNASTAVTSSFSNSEAFRQRIKARKYSTVSPSSREAQLESGFFKPGLVIFDKDGTLVCFHTMWTPWCTSLADRMNRATGKDVSEHVYDVLGYDHAQKKVKIGALAENTHPQIRDKIEEMLKMSLNLEPRHAKQVLDHTWRDTPDDMEIKMTSNLTDLFSRLKNQGVKIAVCTSDSREGTHEFLEKTNLENYVDMIMCGDDPNGMPKPNPHNALHICRELNVSPTDTIMVGDTPADTLMGQQANLGLTVGVLTGVGGLRDLQDADVIVSDVNECVDMILPDDAHPQRREQPVVYQVTTRGISKIAQRSLLHHDTPFFMNPSSRTFSTSSRVSSSAKQYSHIIVGAGSAGCVLTHRLSEESSNDIMLLEAGPKDTILGSTMLQWKIHMPAALMYNLCDDKYNWYYHTEPQEHCNNRKMYWPRGRVLGGSSSLNAMVYIRGHALDYDNWEDMGAKGWNYQNCLPYFKKAQNHPLGGDDYRGDSGPLHVSRGTSGNTLHDVFLEAGRQAGHFVTDDINGYRQEGVGLFDMTTYKGKRWSTASAYLRPALKARSERITVKDSIMVHKILFDGNKAIGVEVADSRGNVEKIYGNEVILCGGAINSPQILMLSGIGNADDLKALDIPVVAHVPGVGQNLQDHIEVYVVQKCKKPVTLLQDQKFPWMIKVGVQWFLNQTGSCGTTHLESGGFTRSRPGVKHPDIMWHFLPSQVIDHGRKAPTLEAFQLHVGPMRPTSRGWLKIKSKDPKEHPIIQPNYLSTEIDRWELRESVKLSREIFAQKAFDEFRDVELEPGDAAQTDEQIDAFIREKSDSSYHPSCTCRMGDTSANDTVVAPDGKVVGVEGLRVVDASIMPQVASGNLNAPTIMIAERMADLIKGKDPLPPANVPVYQPPTLETRR